MSAAVLIWWEIHLLLLAAYLFLKGARFFFIKKEKLFLEKMAPALLLFSLALPFLMRMLPQKMPAPPVAERATQMMGQAFPAFAFPFKEDRSLLVLNAQAQVQNWAPNLLLTGLLLFLLGFFLWAISRGRDLLTLCRLIRRSQPLRTHRKIKILFSTETAVPFSFRSWQGIFVVMPMEFLGGQHFWMALHHEFEHHRRGDTWRVYFYELIRGLFYFNPIMHLWLKEINQAEELSCDQAVMKRHHFSARAYAQCLLDVAISSQNSRVPLTGAKAMASFHVNTLKRRIEMICAESKTRAIFTWPKLAVITAGAFVLLFQLAYAQRELAHVRELTLQEARNLAKESTGEIPVEVNSRVLKWLNHFLSTQKGRTYMRTSKEAMERYESVIKEGLKKEGMPEELMAVALMESGFSNERVSAEGAGGIWQFMPFTARRFHLQVDETLDERFDVKKLTRATADFYRTLLAIPQFKKDWRLALLAYNAGEQKVLEAMRQQQTDDPWRLVGVGDKDYLAKIMAGILLLKNPTLTNS